MNENINLIHGDCLEKMKDIPDKSVNLVLIDPPYNISKDKWDKWKSVNEYVEFMGKVFKELERVLKDNGSFYFFHNDFLQIVELQNYINKNTKFKFNSFIVWDKGDTRALAWKKPSEKNNLRSWFNTCEYCLYYTFQDETGLSKIMLDVNNFKTLRGYFKYIQEKIGINKKINHNLPIKCLIYILLKSFDFLSNVINKSAYFDSFPFFKKSWKNTEFLEI